tara:strand:- start:1097 stop:1744 length:648 start_codon:yes stop_codon:yes gene_type:complete
MTYDKEHTYILYVVVDNDDPIYCNDQEKNKIYRFLSVMKNVNIKFIDSTGIPKGHVTLMWNRAFKQAYEEKCDYFFQCGDDIKFLNIGWVNKSIEKLQTNNNLGLTGPLDYDRWMTGSNSRPGGPRFIQTQSFVSRKHMEIFGFYFPPEIKNWYCDDWMTYIYYPNHYYFIKCFVKNDGGPPRYKVIGSLNPNDPIRKKCFELVKMHRKLIASFQ